MKNDEVLYLRVDSEKNSSDFVVCGRSEGHAKWLLNSVPIDGGNKAP